MDPGHALKERIVAGYRVLRTLARGDRSEILLGFEPPAPGSGESGSTVALKVISDPDATAVAAEVEALTRGAGDHVVELIDVSVDEAEACLVLERLERGGLNDLLLRRTALDVGEVVTIIAPLVAAVERLHESGVAHGGISSGAIAFSASGAPVLTGFGAAVLFPPRSPEVVRERLSAVLADRRACGELAIALLRRVDDADAVIEKVERLLAGESAGLLGRLADLLFGMSAASPVCFAAEPSPAPRSEQRVVAAVDALEVADPADRAAEGGSAPRSTSRLAWLIGVLPDPMRDRLSRVMDEPLVRTLRERWHDSPPRRRRLLLAAGAVGATLVVAWAIPGGGQAPDPDRPIEAATPSVVEAPAVVADDPVAALRTLWARRLDCLRERSILCLDGVDQPGSAALDADRALIAALGAGRGAPSDLEPDAELLLVERLGDSALIELPDGSEADSVLLIRGDDGWRIRDYLGGPRGSEQAG